MREPLLSTDSAPCCTCTCWHAEFLAFEVAACRMNKANGASNTAGASSSMATDADNADTEEQMVRRIADTLAISNTEMADGASFVAAVGVKITALLQQTGPGYLAPPLLAKPLNAEQTVKLNEICATMAEEYAVRRQMLLKRLEVTIQSFKWSGKGKVSLSSPPPTHTPTHPPLSLSLSFLSLPLRRCHPQHLLAHRCAPFRACAPTRSVSGVLSSAPLPMPARRYAALTGRLPRATRFA